MDPDRGYAVFEEASGHADSDAAEFCDCVGAGDASPHLPSLGGRQGASSKLGTARMATARVSP